MKIERFEDLECWQLARKLVKNVYELTCHGLFTKDFGLRDQIRRASVSIMANIAESFGCTSAEQVRFLNIAVRSAYEVQSHLYIAIDLEYITLADFDVTFKEIIICIKLCKGLIKYLQQKRCNETKKP